MHGNLNTALDFSGRGVVITGGANGIGLAATRLFLAHGARVTVVDNDGDALERLDRELDESSGVEPVHADVALEADVTALFERLRTSPGRPSVLVNNVGIGARKPTTDLETETWSRVLDVNLTGAFVCSREFAKHRGTGDGATIVNVASIMGLVGNELYPNVSYHASKGGLVNMTRALAVEWAPLGIRVNAVAPTFVETGLTRKLLADAQAREAILRKTPLRRLADPSDVANGIVFLASDAARLITGTVLPIDGGWLSQ